MPEIIEYYNNRKHGTTYKAPAETTADDEEALGSRQNARAKGTRAKVDAYKPGDRVRLLIARPTFGKGRMRWSDDVYTISERIDGTNSFRVEGMPNNSYKYNELQRVGAGSAAINPKAPETQAMATKREHALKLGRSGLARGVPESEALIDSVARLPPDRPRRERHAPAWHSHSSLVSLNFRNFNKI